MSDLALDGVRAEWAGRGQWHERGRQVDNDTLDQSGAHARRTMVDAIDDLQPLDLVEHGGWASSMPEMATPETLDVETHRFLVQEFGFLI